MSTPFRLIAVGMATLSGLLLLEAGSLVLLRTSETASRPTYVGGGTLRGGRRDSEVWGVWGVPGYAGTLSSECFNVAYSFNQSGARDRERARTGAHRTIVLGDSFMEGYGVAADERLSDLLEASRHRPFLNFATAGDFGPLQFQLVYQHLASAFEHEALLVGLFPGNDFTDNDPEFVRSLPQPDRGRYRPVWRLSADRLHYSVEYTGIDHRGRFVPGFEPDASTLRRALRYSATAILVHYLWQQRWQRASAGESPSTATGYFETDARRLAAVELIFEDLSRLAGARPRTMLVIPDLEEIDRARATGTRGSPPFLDLLARLSAQHWTVVDLMPRLLDLTPAAARELFFACDGHWSAAGHQFAAAALSAAVP